MLTPADKKAIRAIVREEQKRVVEEIRDTLHELIVQDSQFGVLQAFTVDHANRHNVH